MSADRATLKLPSRSGAAKRLTPEQLQQRVRATLAVDNPRDNSASLSVERENQIQLRVTDIDPYDRNPRRAENALYYQIKESVRTARVISPLTVTKRPGSDRYMVSAGGNTRLKAQKELWDETGDPRYEFLLVTYRPWVSESQVLMSHLIENELHAGMSFWDKARGIFDLRSELSKEREGALSLRALHDAMRERGLTVSITLLSFYGFALEQLADLGPATATLTGRAVRDLQPAFAFLSNYLLAHDRTADDWQTVRRQVLQQWADDHRPSAEAAGTDDAVSKQGGLDATALISRLEEAVAHSLEQSPSLLRQVRQLQRTVSDAQIPELVKMVLERDDRGPNQNSGVQGRGRAAARKTTASSHDLPAAPEPKQSAREAGHEGGSSAAPAASPTVATQGSDPASTPTSDALEAVAASAVGFAEACQVDDLLRTCPEMPCGFFVEVPSDDQPLDIDERSLRYGGWWLTAMLADQIDGSYASRLPADSRWRQAQLLENGSDHTTLEMLIQSTLGNAFGLVDLGQWLTRCPDAVATQYGHLLAAVRRVRAELPERFMLDGDSGL